MSATLIYGDCLEKMKDIPDNSIDMILCDLPYGTTACKWDKEIELASLWEQYRRIIKDNCAIVLFGKGLFSSKLMMSNQKEYKHSWIWNKKQSGSFQNAKYMPLQITEEILVFCKNGAKVRYFPIMRKGKMRKRGGAKFTNRTTSGLTVGYENCSDMYYPVNIIEIANPRKNKYHPTEKPVPLLEYLIKTYTNEGETVLDNCIGSGSTGVACLNTGRNFIGIELDRTYFGIAKKRIKEIEE